VELVGDVESSATSYTPLSLALLHVGDLQRKADVRRDREIRIERSSGTPSRCRGPRREVRDIALTDEDRAASTFEAGEHAQGRLARPEGPTSTMNSPSSIHRSSASTAGKSFPDRHASSVEADVSHRFSTPSRARRGRA
jgi:hypothetical protein